MIAVGGAERFRWFELLGKLPESESRRPPANVRVAAAAPSPVILAFFFSPNLGSLVTAWCSWKPGSGDSRLRGVFSAVLLITLPTRYLGSDTGAGELTSGLRSLEPTDGIRLIFMEYLMFFRLCARALSLNNC